MEKTITLPANITKNISDKKIKLEIGKYNVIKKPNNIGQLRVNLPSCGYSSMGYFTSNLSDKYSDVIRADRYDDNVLNFSIRGDFICLSQFTALLNTISDLANKWEQLETYKEEIRRLNNNIGSYHENIYNALSRITSSSSSSREVKKVLSICKKLVIKK